MRNEKKDNHKTFLTIMQNAYDAMWISALLFGLLYLVFNQTNTWRETVCYLIINIIFILTFFLLIRVFKKF